VGGVLRGSAQSVALVERGPEGRTGAIPIGSRPAGGLLLTVEFTRDRKVTGFLYEPDTTPDT